MSNPYNQGDTVGRGDMEETVDTGGVNPGQVAGNQFANTGDNLVGDRGVALSDEELEQDVEDTLDRMDELGIERELTDEQQDYLEEQAELAEQQREDAAERAAEERAKDEAREEAHANEEAFYEGETTVENVVFEDGEYVVVEQVGYEYSLPDGTTIVVDENGDAIAVEWPEGEGPVYIGDVLVDGEPCAVYELPTGNQIVVDADGNTIGTLDEVDVDDMSVPKYWITGDKEDVGEMVTIEMVPDPDGSYDTHIVDAESGDVLKELDTGSEALGYNVGQTGEDGQEIYQTYVPPGADYYIVIDTETGEVVGTHPLPDDPEWSVLGIVEYYEGGEVVVDVGAAEVSIDVVGPDGGISVDLDVLIVEGTAGIEWNEDGSWDFDVSAEADIGGAEVGVDVGFGQDAAGMWHVDVETSLEMQYGVLSLSGGQEAHFQQTEDGFEMSLGFEGKVSGFGLYVERSQDLSFVLDDDGATMTYSDMIGAGIAGVGGIQVVGEAQVRVDDDGSVEGAAGTYGRLVDRDGDEVVGAGAYLDSEEGGYFSDQQLDTGADYERQYGEGERPPALGSDAESRGQEDAERYGLAGQEGEDATGRLERAGVETAPEGIHDIHMNQGSVRAGQEGEDDTGAGSDESPEGIHGMETGFGGRSARLRTGEDGETPEVPRAVTEALAGRYAEVGSNASRILGQTEGSNWRMAGQDDDDALMRPSFGDGAIEPERFYDKGNQAAGVREGDEPEGVTLPGIDKLVDSGGQVLDESSVGSRYLGETEKNLDDDAASGVRNPDVAAEIADQDADGVFVPGRTYSVSDDPTLDDITGASPVRQTADAGPDRSEVLIERPSDVGVQTTDAGPDQSTGRLERPDEDRRFTMDAGTEELSGDADWEAGVRSTDALVDDGDAAIFSASPEEGLADDVTGVWTDMRPLAADGGEQAEAADEPHVVDEPVPMRDADRGQLPDGYGDGKRSEADTNPAADLIDDIAPVAPAGARPEPAVATQPDHAPVEPEQVESEVPGFQALPELDAVVATGQAPEAESVAQVETAIPAFRPEVDDEVVVAVEIDVTASVVDLAGDDELFNTDAGTTELDDQADDQLGEG